MTGADQGEGPAVAAPGESDGVRGVGWQSTSELVYTARLHCHSWEGEFFNSAEILQ